MFLLLRFAFKKLYSRSKDRNVCILGLDSAGKSSLLNHIRYEFGEPNFVSAEEMVPTIGLNFSKIQYQNFSLTLWDVGGQQRFREVWESYFHDIDLLVWVLDSADRTRFEESYEEFKKVMSNSQLIYTPVAIVANKQDKEGAVQEDEVIKALHLDQLGSNFKYKVFLTSFAGDFSDHLGLEGLLAWVVITFKSEPISKQRSEWRKSTKDPQDSADNIV